MFQAKIRRRARDNVMVYTLTGITTIGYIQTGLFVITILDNLWWTTLHPHKNYSTRWLINIKFSILWGCSNLWKYNSARVSARMKRDDDGIVIVHPGMLQYFTNESKKTKKGSLNVRPHDIASTCHCAVHYSDLSRAVSLTRHHGAHNALPCRLSRRASRIVDTAGDPVQWHCH